MNRVVVRRIVRAVAVVSIAATAAAASGCYGGGGGGETGSREQDIVAFDEARELYTPEGCDALEAELSLEATRVDVEGAPDLAAIVVDGAVVCVGPAYPGVGSEGAVEDLDLQMRPWSGRLAPMQDAEPMTEPRPEPDRPTTTTTVLVRQTPEPDVAYAAHVEPAR